MTLEASLKQGLEHLKTRFNVASELFQRVLLIQNTDLEEEGVVSKEGIALEELIPAEPIKDGAKLSDRD